jgi:hypothetical protein
MSPAHALSLSGDASPFRLGPGDGKGEGEVALGGSGGWEAHGLGLGHWEQFAARQRYVPIADTRHVM